MHTLKPILDHPEYFNVEPDGAVIEFPASIDAIAQNFCLTPAGDFPDVGITILPLTQARPGFESRYKIVYFDSGTDTLSGDFTLSFEDELMIYANSTETPSDNNPSLLRWTYEDLAPFERRSLEVTMLLNRPTEDPPLLGDDILAFTARINPIAGDANESDNQFTLNQTVVNSYDPNDKTCLQGDMIKPEMVGEYVDYLIRFENTGSASAINVVVKDTDRFDVSSLRIIDASDNLVTRVTKDSIVEFIFENIELPFDDANNDGYILFKIKTLPTLSIGDVLENDAEIFFDFNPAIETNVASTEIKILTTLKGESSGTDAIQIFPNPAQDAITVSANQNIERISLMKIDGTQVFEQVIIGLERSVSINLSGISVGLYIVRVYGPDGWTAHRVIVEER